MQYDLSDIQTVLGAEFNPKAEYRISRHATVLRLKKQGFKQVGELPDFTADQEGTMLIMAKFPESEETTQ